MAIKTSWPLQHTRGDHDVSLSVGERAGHFRWLATKGCTDWRRPEELLSSGGTSSEAS